ncbi:MAG: YchJ family protein [Cyanobium sp.]
MPTPRALQTPCPCGGGLYEGCCAPLHRGERRAATAEQLMRSRYSAYALGEVDHLLRTQGPELGSRQPLSVQRRALQDSCRQVRWLRLEILATEAGGALDLEGTVTFRAHYRPVGLAAGGGVMRERSRFGRAGGRLEGAWLYLEALELSG